MSAPFEVIVGRIETLALDAVVNAANKRLLPGSGVDGALRAAAGPELTKHTARMSSLSDGEAAITPELRLLPTPGHTPGHSSIAVASAGERAIILGDVAHHPLHLERLWIAAIDELPRVSRRTKRELARRLIEEQLLVAGGHFASGSFGRLVLADGRRSWRGL